MSLENKLEEKESKGFIKKAMGMGKFIKDWMTKQAALKAATSVLGGKGGGCCCGCCRG